MKKNINSKIQKYKTMLLFTLLVTFPKYVLAAAPAAGEHNWPWRTFLYSLASEFSGPLPTTLGVLGICACAISLFRGNSGEGTNKLIVLILAVSIALTAPTIMSWLSSDATTSLGN